MSETTEHSRVERIGGRLHQILEVRDRAGQVVTQVTAPLKVELHWQDVSQLVVGALVLGVPVALTEEVWVLGETLPGYRIMLIALASVVTLAFFIKALFYAEYSQEYRVEFVKRVVAAYTITLLVALILLFLIDKGPIEDPVLTLNRAVIVAFPASFAATAVDYIK